MFRKLLLLCNITSVFSRLDIQLGDNKSFKSPESVFGMSMEFMVKVRHTLETIQERRDLFAYSSLDKLSASRMSLHEAFNIQNILAVKDQLPTFFDIEPHVFFGNFFQFFARQDSAVSVDLLLVENFIGYQHSYHEEKMDPEKVCVVRQAHFAVVNHYTGVDYVLGVDQTEVRKIEMEVSKGREEGNWDYVGNPVVAVTGIDVSHESKSSSEVYKVVSEFVVLINKFSSSPMCRYFKIERKHKNNIAHNSVQEVHIFPETEQMPSRSNLEDPEEPPTNVEDDSMPKEPNIEFFRSDASKDNFII